jgi:hypothetical protein
MESETTATFMNGTWYVRIKPDYAAHIGLRESDRDSPVSILMRDEENKKGQKYISAWRKGR